MHDLTPNLDPTSPVPQYEQLYRHLSREILSGRLPGGTRLPSRRALSRHLGVSEMTIHSAYDLLQAEGFLTSKERVGLFVEDILPLPLLPERALTSPAQGTQAPLYDFSPQSTDISLFPHALFAKLVREELLDNPDLMNRGDPRGEIGLRAALCQFLYQFRGVHCKQEQLVIASGVDQLLQTVSSLIGEKRKIAVEDPGYPEAARVFQRAGHTVIPLSLDEYGLNPEALENSGADLAYLTPAHQFPTGVSLPASRRSELLGWANRKDGRFLIEDDYDSEFRYASRPLPALQSLDGRGKVVYLSTFSRSLAPGLRVAYMALPEALNLRFDREHLRCGETVSRYEQSAMGRLVGEGHYIRHLRRAGAAYQKRAAVVCGLLSGIAGSFIKGQEAGLHFLFGMKGMDENEVVEQGRRAGIPLSGLGKYAMKAKTEPALVLGFGGLKDGTLDEAVRALRAALGV